MSWPTFNASDFPKTSPEEWREKALQDLKGKSLESLTWMSELGEVPPIFHPESEVPANELPPRSVSNSDNSWEIAQTFSAKNTNKEVVDSLMQGLSYLTLEINTGEESSIHELLKGVHVEMVYLKFKGDYSINQLVKELLQFCENTSQKATSMKGCFGVDHFTKALQSGTIDADKIKESIGLQLNLVTENFPAMRCLPVAAATYFEAGANDVTELALALKIGQLALEAGLANGLSVDDVGALLEFEMASSPSYFNSIAKFRALRSMWASVIESYSPDHACSAVIWIEGVTSERYFATNDHRNNLLRTTTEAMSAIIGSCDSVNVSSCSKGAFDADEARWARNIQHLLREEGWLDAVIDPGNGSYYIEQLTALFMVEASKQLQQWEAKGAFHSLEVLQDIRDHITSNRAKLIEAAQNGSHVIVGVTKFKPKEPLPEKGNFASSLFSPFNVPLALDQTVAQ